MCRRDSTDVLVRNFLDHYQVNLLSMPGGRVGCGSVYIKEGKHVTAPGSLSDIVEPAITLDEPYHEPDLADLSGTWSGSVSLNLGIGLLHNFLTALGAAGLINKLQASVQPTSVKNIAFRFAEVSRARTAGVRATPRPKKTTPAHGRSGRQSSVLGNASPSPSHESQGGSNSVE